MTTDGTVEYTLTKIENNTYSLTVSANAEWMNAEERAYPVVIDPPISVYESNVTDLSINNAGAACSEGDSYLSVGIGYKTYWKTSSLPELPSSAYVSGATIRLKTHLSAAVGTTGGNYIGVYAVILITSLVFQTS